MDIKNLDRCPSLLLPGHTSFSTAALKVLFDGKIVSHILDLDFPTVVRTEGISAIKNAGRLSLSGAQTKFGLVLDEKGKLRYSRPEEQSCYIMKPKPTGYQILNHDFCAANEHLTMQLASQIYGIETAPNCLCFFPDGSMVYITRRFDVHDSGKYAMEDFASLMGLTKANGGSDFKYMNGSYEECAEIIRRNVNAYAIDILRFFQLILFNFITLNDDAHLKNFSLINYGGEYRLSPAYDLINTSLQIYEPSIFALDKGLFKEGMHFSDTNSISRKHFMEFGRRIGLPERIVTQNIGKFSSRNADADSLIERSFLSEKLKRDYLYSYHFRQSLLGND